MGINIQQLSKSYGKNLVLNDISMEFNDDGVIGLLGPNGAGKTTLMKILMGYLNQWDGQITIDSLDLRKDLRSIQQQMGYLPENNPLYLDMYV